MTTKLSDLHYVLLATAANRNSGSLLPPSVSVKSPRASITKAIRALIGRGFAEETETKDAKSVWREEGERKLAAGITDAGRAAINLADGKEPAPSAPPPAPKEEASQSSVEHNEPVSAADVSTTRPGTKQALLITMLGGKTGASLGELAHATGWLPHTTRAALTGLRKKGKAIASEKVNGITRYRLGGAA